MLPVFGSGSSFNQIVTLAYTLLFFGLRLYAVCRFCAISMIAVMSRLPENIELILIDLGPIIRAVINKTNVSYSGLKCAILIWQIVCTTQLS